MCGNSGGSAVVTGRSHLSWNDLAGTYEFCLGQFTADFQKFFECLGAVVGWHEVITPKHGFSFCQRGLCPGPASQALIDAGLPARNLHSSGMIS